MQLRPLQSLGLGVLGAVLLGLTGYATASGTRVRVTAQLPTSAQAGTAARVPGRATHAPAGAVTALERQAAGTRWIRLATAPIHSGRFTLRWTPGAAGFLTVRVVVLRRHVLLAKTPAATLLVGTAPVYCAPPATPSVPAGEGAIVGGVYSSGGAPPGIFVCQGQANTVTLATVDGTTVATQQVAAHQSYAFVVPAGTYALSSGYCRGEATVTAGGSTHADTVCNVP